MSSDNSLEFSIEGDSSKVTSALDDILQALDTFQEKVKALQSIDYGSALENSAANIKSALGEAEAEAARVADNISSSLSNIQVEPIEVTASVNTDEILGATEALGDTQTQSQNTREELGTPFVITAGDVITQAQDMSSALENVATAHAKINESSARIGLLNGGAISEEDIKSLSLAYQNEDHSMQDVLALEKKLALQKVDSKEKMEDLIPVYQDWGEAMGTTGANAMAKTTPMFKAFGVTLQDQQQYMEGIVSVAEETSLGLDGLATASQRVGYNFADSGMSINDFTGYLLAAKSKGLGDRQMFSLLNQGLAEIKDNAKKAGTEVPKGTEAVKALADTLGWSVDDVQKFITSQEQATGKIEAFTEAEKKGHTAFQAIETSISKATYGLQEFVTPLEPAAAGVLGIASAGAQLAIFDKFLLDGKLASGVSNFASKLPLLGTGAEAAIPGLTALVGPAGILAVGLGAVTLAAYTTNLGGFRDNINEVFDDISSAASKVSTGDYEAAGKDCGEAFGDGFEAALGVGVGGVNALTGLDGAISKLKTGFDAAAREMAEGFTDQITNSVSGMVISAPHLLFTEEGKRELTASIKQAIANIDLSSEGSIAMRSFVSGFSGLDTLMNPLIQGVFESLQSSYNNFVKSLPDLPGLSQYKQYIQDQEDKTEEMKRKYGLTQPTNYASGISPRENSVKPSSGLVLTLPQSSGNTGSIESAIKSGFEAFKSDKNKGLSENQKYSDEALLKLYDNPKIKENYEALAKSQTAVSTATENLTTAVNTNSKTIEAVNSKTTPGQEAESATTNWIKATSTGGAGSGSVLDQFTVDPAGYLHDKLTTAAKNAGYDTVSEYEKYLNSYGETIKQKAQDLFSEEKGEGFGGNWDFDQWYSKASEGMPKTSGSVDTLKTAVANLGDVGYITDSKVSPLKTTLMDVGNYGAAAVSQINAALASVDASFASIQSYITKAQTASQYQPDTQYKSSMTDKYGPTYNIYNTGNTYGKSTDPNTQMSGLVSGLRATGA